MDLCIYINNTYLFIVAPFKFSKRFTTLQGATCSLGR